MDAEYNCEHYKTQVPSAILCPGHGFSSQDEGPENIPVVPGCHPLRLFPTSLMQK
ncbi:Hypothetical predicted protein [Podarcis lilfordi]|uniref:Uncharacterized protein n=1 Tax=Podarcis lilfordi TaxID=74358 RepID=A0AA35LBH8_9SAUR|nr:Hypothetical predicted protein [Podarcis lilfordi]